MSHFGLRENKNKKKRSNIIQTGFWGQGFFVLKYTCNKDILKLS